MTDVAHEQNVVEVIHSQHEEIERLLGQVSAGGPARDDAFDALVRLLAVHETAEEMAVYPSLRSLGDEGKAVVEARTSEEDRAKKVLAKLEGMDKSSAEFVREFAAFQGDVKSHAASEEAEVFPLLMRSDANGRAEMAKAFLLAESMAPTHAHRMAPESATGNMLVGPFVAMVDKVRDAISRRRD
ncbi:MAG: hemerythrin domain-containing protein [Ilumatobacteraceae bacterium]